MKTACGSRKAAEHLQHGPSYLQTLGLPRMEDGSGALVFRDCGRARDFSLFGRIVNTLKRQTWFMDNVSVWRLCDSDDSDSPDDFNEEDLLTHYQEKTAMRA